MANNTDQLFGDYSPTTDPRFVKTPLKGLTELNFSMNYAAGCVDGTRCLNYSQDDVKTALVGADLVVVCLGTGKREPVKSMHIHSLLSHVYINTLSKVKVVSYHPCQVNIFFLIKESRYTIDVFECKEFM